MINNNLLVIHCHMKRKKAPRALIKHLRRFASIAGKAGSAEDKSAAGKAGMAKRWAHIQRCPACHRPATKEQQEAMKAAQHGAAETKIV
jgi:hypothetical protein